MLKQYSTGLTYFGYNARTGEAIAYSNRSRFYKDFCNFIEDCSKPPFLPWTIDVLMRNPDQWIKVHDPCSRCDHHSCCKHYYGIEFKAKLGFRLLAVVFISLLVVALGIGFGLLLIRIAP